MKILLSFLFFFILHGALSQGKTFRFAFLSDTHIGSPGGGAEEDLRRTVADINSMEDIAFVVLTGDITELGKRDELEMAKQLLDSLRVRYYIIPGNHDTGWSGSGGLDFSKVFGDDKFHFVHNGIHFIGCASGPYVRMSDGHVPRHHIDWLQKELNSIKEGAPIVFLNHYPLDNSLDNWYEVVDLLKTKNTVLALCGHGHNNRAVDAEDIPAVMGRSNLRAKAAEGGYNLVEVSPDSFLFTVRTPLTKKEKRWQGVPFRAQHYSPSKKYARPDLSLNKRYPQVGLVWRFHSDANVVSTPAVFGKTVVFGNGNGEVLALSRDKGKRVWSFKTAGPIFSSPAADGSAVLLGSSDGAVYAFGPGGKLLWKRQSSAAVLGSPRLEGSVVYIGGSDGCFRALDVKSGASVWEFCGLKGAVTSQPVLQGNTLLFGAWDGNLYALDKNTGTLLWTWNNGSPVINYAPAACIPVVHDGVVYVVAPDRYLTAIDVQSGKALWRTNSATVRESIGISADGRLVYAKTMQDTIVAFHTARDRAQLAWKFSAGFGYEHVPSMLMERNGRVYFGTKNGVVYCIDPLQQKVNWAYKIDNSMVNTVSVLANGQLIASTMDGKVVLLQERVSGETSKRAK